MKKYLSIVFYILVINTAFAILTHAVFNGQISNARTLIDYFYFGIVTLTSTGYGDMVARTQHAKIWVSAYILFAYSFIIYLAI
jgi:hypothetical protein